MLMPISVTTSETVKHGDDSRVDREQKAPGIGAHHHRVEHRQRGDDKQIGHHVRRHGDGAVAQHREDREPAKSNTDAPLGSRQKLITKSMIVFKASKVKTKFLSCLAGS